MKESNWPQLWQVNIFGLWHGSGLRGCILKMVSYAFMFFLAPALICSEIQFIRQAFLSKDIMLALETLNMLGSAIQFYGTSLTFIFYRNSLERTISLIENVTEKVMTEEGEFARREILERKKFGLKVHKIFVGTYIFLQSWSIQPMLNFLIYDIRGYAVNSWLPFDSSSTVGYLSNFVLQSSTCCCYCMGYCMFGSLLVAICELLFGHVDILRQLLENVKFGTSNTIDELVKCIKYHGDIIQICQELQNLTAPPLIFNCIFTVIVLCIVLVNITTTEDNANVLNLIIEAQLVLMFLGTYCWYGNEITSRFSQLLIPPYMSNWYNGTETEKKLALNVMTRTMTPMYFGGFIRIDILTFVNILKGAFSFYNVINVIKE